MANDQRYTACVHRGAYPMSIETFGTPCAQCDARVRDDVRDGPQRVEEIRAALADENPKALWPDGFDGAFIGPARRCGQPTLAAFSVAKCIQILMERDDMSYEEADEWMGFNVVGAWLGEGTPIWIDDVNDP
jgi:hypothetical protein